MKKKFLSISLLCLILFALTACKESFEGTWYEYGENPDDSYHQLTLSEDGLFITGSEEGNWSVSEDKLMLLTTWDSATLTIVKENGKKDFIEEDGTVWTQDYQKVKEEYERLTLERETAEEEAEAAEAEAKENQIAEGLAYVKDNLMGKYIAEESYMDTDYILELYEDGTYEYYTETEGEVVSFETGRWNLDEESYILDEIRTYASANILLDATETNNDIREYREEDGIDVILRNLRCILDYDSDRILERMYLDGDGFGFSSGAIYVPSGIYEKE